MEEIYQKLGILNLWGEVATSKPSSDETSFEVTEGWLQHASGKIKTKHRRVHFENLASWLAEDSKGAGGDAQSLVLRLAWLDVDVKSRHVKLSDSVKKVLLDEFDLQLAHRYAQSCITNVSAFPPSNGHRAYSFSYVPKLASVWSHRRLEAQTPWGSPFLTQGLVFVQEAEKALLEQFLSTPWNYDLYANAMFPAFLFSLLLGVQMQKTEDEIKKGVRAMEKRTGHHNFANRYEEAATEENGKLSAQANGYATKLASVARKSKMVERLLRFILQMVEDEDATRVNASLPPTDGCVLLRNHVAVLQDRLAMQNVDTEYTLKRVQIQISALAGIISRNDSISNLVLAESQREIAIHSYRDSSSMKTLAIVTMFFLPGSFISALFSTSMFNWDGIDPSSSHIGVETKPQFTLYWVITIPLTVVTFLLYFLWLWLMKKQRDLRMQQLADKDSAFGRLSDQEKGETEENRLARTRRETMLAKNSSSFALSL